LFINKNKPLQIRSSSTGIGGFKLSNSYPLNDLKNLCQSNLQNEKI